VSVIDNIKRSVTEIRSKYYSGIIQSDQKVSVHLMITDQKNTQKSWCLTADLQGQGDTRLTLTPSVIPNYNYVIMVSD
jgi:hypothetical protein